MGVKRVYVEKKPEFAVQAKELRHEVKSYLGIKTVKNVRVLIRYDVENLSDATFERDFFLCMAGLNIGKKFGTKLSGKASILGGVILIGIGLEIFISGVL